MRAGKFGGTHTSDYVTDEAITTALTRTRKPDLAVHPGKPLSFTDYLSLALMEKNRIKQIINFDSDLTGPTKRIH